MVRHRRLRRLLVVALPACVVASVATSAAVGAASPEVPGAFEAWSATTGWQPLPEPPTVPPSLSWDLEPTADAAISVQAGAVVVVAPTLAAKAEVQRIEPSTGAQVWRTSIVGGQEADVAIDPTGSLVVVATRSPADGQVVTPLGAAKGQVIWSARQLDVVPFVQSVGGWRS